MFTKFVDLAEPTFGARCVTDQGRQNSHSAPRPSPCLVSGRTSCRSTQVPSIDPRPRRSTGGRARSLFDELDALVGGQSAVERGARKWWGNTVNTRRRRRGSGPGAGWWRSTGSLGKSSGALECSDRKDNQKGSSPSYNRTAGAGVDKGRGNVTEEMAVAASVSVSRPRSATVARYQWKIHSRNAGS